MDALLDKKIYLNGLPNPPSCNALYPTFRGRRIKSKALIEFTRSVGYWGLAHKLTVLEAREVCQYWISVGYFLKLSAEINFKKERIFCKDGRVKKMDASNRIKALHDSISESILCIDDSYFWSVSIEKMVSDLECVNVTIEPVRCQFNGGIPQG